jgi:DtxR family Mn-dependent transcriptional regulator
MNTIKDNKLSASMEDYLEAIFHLSSAGRVARSKDIAEQLNVSRASVTGALRILSDKDLIHYKPYGSVTLTEKGTTEAGKIVRRHRVLESFFVDILGLDAETAKESACRAEHALGQHVVGRLRHYIEFVAHWDGIHGDMATEFRQFYGGRTLPDLPRETQ